MNERVIKNPNFKSHGEFHKSLASRGVGAKEFSNSHTEVEHLGGGKFGASISVGHRVFFDKADGNKPKKHKLTDERPSKDYVLIQGAKCCVEVYPYYAKYFDVQHEEVSLYEERWVVQRWREPPANWFDIGAWNPVITAEEYSEPAGDVVKVTVTYNTDYGTLTVEYFQRDGNALKHNVTFKNTSGLPETFRVLQRWAGIVGTKVNGKDFPLVTNQPSLAFRKADEKLAIAENLISMVFNRDGTEKTDQCLKRPINIESHAQGMKADFIYGNWVLAQNESLEIDPDSTTKDNPTEDGYIRGNNYDKIPAATRIQFGVWDSDFTNYKDRGFVEWNVIGLIVPPETITKVEFRYEGKLHHASASNADVRKIVDNQPSTHPSGGGAGQAIEVWTEIATTTAYLSNNAAFPEVGVDKDVGGASGPAWDVDPCGDLETAVTATGWWAFGFMTQETEDPDAEVDWTHHIYSEEEAGVQPPPTLYVEYGVPEVAKKHTFSLDTKPHKRMRFHPNLKLG